MAKRRDSEPESDPLEEALAAESEAITEAVETSPATPVPPDPWVVMGQVAAALQAIAAKLDSPTAASGDTGQQLMAIQERLAQTMDRLADANIQGAQIIATETKR